MSGLYRLNEVSPSFDGSLPMRWILKVIHFDRTGFVIMAANFSAGFANVSLPSRPLSYQEPAIFKRLFSGEVLLFEHYELLVISHAWLFYFIDFFWLSKLLAISRRVAIVIQCHCVFNVLNLSGLDTSFYERWAHLRHHRPKDLCPNEQFGCSSPLPMFIFMDHAGTFRCRDA